MHCLRGELSYLGEGIQGGAYVSSEEGYKEEGYSASEEGCIASEEGYTASEEGYADPMTRIPACLEGRDAARTGMLGCQKVRDAENPQRLPLRPEPFSERLQS